MEKRAEAAETRLVELVERARGGDREAYGELVEMTWTQVVGLTRTILAGDDEAEDVAQEAFIHAWPRLGSLRDAARFPAWIRRIASRRCFAHHRRQRHRAEIEPASRADTSLERIDIERTLALLAPRQRAVIYLTEVEGRSASEAAAVLGILPATARVHRHRGLARLRRELGEWRS